MVLRRFLFGIAALCLCFPFAGASGKSAARPVPAKFTQATTSKPAIVISLDSIERYRFLNATPVSRIKTADQLKAKMKQGELSVIETRLRASRSEKDVNRYLSCVRTEVFEPRFQSYVLEAVATLCLASREDTITKSNLRHVYSGYGIPRLALDKVTGGFNPDLEAGLPPADWDRVRDADKVQISAQGRELICKVDPTLCRECSKFDRDGVKYVNATGQIPPFLEKVSRARLSQIRDSQASIRLSHLLEAEELGKLKRSFPSLNVDDVVLYYAAPRSDEDSTSESEDPNLQRAWGLDQSSDSRPEDPRLCIPCQPPATFNESSGSCTIEKCNVGKNFIEGKSCPERQCFRHDQVLEDGQCVLSCARECEIALSNSAMRLGEIEDRNASKFHANPKERTSQIDLQLSDWRAKLDSLKLKSKGCKDRSIRQECEEFKLKVLDWKNELSDYFDSSFACPQGLFKIPGIGCAPQACSVCSNRRFSDVPTATSFGNCNATLMDIGRTLFIEERENRLETVQKQCLETKGRSDILEACIRMNNPMPDDYAARLRANGILCNAGPATVPAQSLPAGDKSVGE